MANNLVIAVETVEGALEGVGENEASDEVANSDLPLSELGLKVDVPIGLEGVEKDLAIGALDHRFEVVLVHGDVHGIGPRSLVRADAQIRNTLPQ